VLGLDFVDDAGFAGLGIGIFVYAEIFLCQLVDVIVGAIFGDFDDAAANLEIAVRVLGIDDGERDAGIAADVAVLLRPLAELKMTCSPSKSTHTGVTCGRPSGINVPRLAKARFWNRSRYFSGITCDIRASGKIGLPQHYRPRGDGWAARPFRVFPVLVRMWPHAKSTHEFIAKYLWLFHATCDRPRCAHLAGNGEPTSREGLEKWGTLTWDGE
jgi:hypothetical protein